MDKCMFVVTVFWNTHINLVSNRPSSYYRVLNVTDLNYISLIIAVNLTQ